MTASTPVSMRALNESGWIPAAAGEVFPIGDDKVDGIIVPDPVHTVVDGVTAGFADDIADDENVHCWAFERGVGVSRD